MADLKQAAQQALEALEWHYRQGHSNTLGGFRLKIDEKALRELSAALAQQDEPVAWLQPKTVDAHSRPDLGYETCSKDDYGAFPVYTALPQRKPVQEPVTTLGYAARKIEELIAQRDALLEALKYIAKQFRQHGRQHWPEAVVARFAIEVVEGEKK
jgi:hypothetical protein